ncbi:MAG: aminotransferase class I/II-fold pyridoxal phosphate-dependent enzyme [Pseudomonadota bacterium]
MSTLGAAAKDKLLAAGRASRQARIEQKLSRTMPAKRAGSGGKAFDFATLPGMRDIALQRTAADVLNIESPFFRPHDGRAAAHTIIRGREYINFSSYDYVGLNGDPRVSAAAQAATEAFGTSVSASRVVSGERPFHRALEEGIARFIGVEDAIVMVSGHATNVTTIGHLLTKDDVIICDSFAHNSITEGARLSGATRHAFNHNDLDHLERQLSTHRHKFKRALIAVEGLYSMDGDSPSLKRLVELKTAYDAWLLVDEAHGLGVVGKTGRGLAERDGVDPNAVELWMGTLSKTLASCGGFIAGSSALIEYLKATAPGFVFSVGLPPASSAAALAALEALDAEPERVTKLCQNGGRFLARAKAAGLDCGTSEGLAVVPVILGDSVVAAVVSHKLAEVGINVQPIIYPAVPEKAARLRFFINSTHTFDDIDAAVDRTAEVVHATLKEGDGLKILTARISS